MAISFSRPDPSSPASVGSASFAPSRRGFDQTEVREFLRMVAAELARLQERERFLESELKAAQTNGMSAPGRLDEHTLIALLGEETARVLASAREASSQIRDRAEESATRMVKEASEDAARIRQSAHDEAQRLRDDASGDAQGEIELAKQQGREMVEEARAYREKVLAELSRRRDAVRTQIEQMLHGRDRILAVFERARSASDEVINEFVALDGASQEGTTVAADHPSIAIFDHEREDAALRSDDSTGVNVTRGSDLVHEVADVEVVHTEDTVDEIVVRGETESKPQFFDLVAEEAADQQTADSPALPSTHPSTQEPVDSIDDEFVAPVVSIFGGRRRPTVLDSADNSEMVAEDTADEIDVVASPVAEPVTEPVLAPIPEPNPEPIVDDAADHSTRTSPGKQAIDDIFARLRASAPSTVADKANAAEPAVIDRLVPITPVTPVVQPERFVRRDEVLAPLCEQIAKKMKRALSDELNSILDHVNGKKPKLETDAMVSDSREHVARYVSVISEEILAAAAEGARSMKSAHGSVKRVDQKKVDEAVSELVDDTIVAPLRARLDQLLRDCDGNTDDIAEGVRAVYREWRMSRIDAHSADIACAAHSRGAFLSLKEGTEICWMVDPKGPACADAEDNSLAGAVPCGEKFPTGHEHPLAHPGCRCLVCPKPH